METLVRPRKILSQPSEDMPRKKMDSSDAAPKSPQPKIHQMSLRIFHEDFLRIEKTARKLGLDPTSLIRMILKQKLAEYERLAEEVQ